MQVCWKAYSQWACCSWAGAPLLVQGNPCRRLQLSMSKPRLPSATLMLLTRCSKVLKLYYLCDPIQPGQRQSQSFHSQRLGSALMCSAQTKNIRVQATQVYYKYTIAVHENGLILLLYTLKSLMQYHLLYIKHSFVRLHGPSVRAGCSDSKHLVQRLGCISRGLLCLKQQVTFRAILKQSSKNCT